MTEPGSLSIAAAYLGAGAFYVGEDLVSSGWSDDLRSPLTVLALALGAVGWAPVCLWATLKYARIGWRHALRSGPITMARIVGV